jgi:hypothetical protein
MARFLELCSNILLFHGTRAQPHLARRGGSWLECRPLILLIAFMQFWHAACGIFQPSKQTYTVVGLPMQNELKWKSKWKATWEDYLNAAVGIKFRVNFSLVAAATDHEMYAAYNSRRADFFILAPNFISCLGGSASGLTPIATMRNLYEGVESSVYGGNIFSRADDTTVKSVTVSI